LRYAASRTRDHDAARDVVQETLICAARRIRRLGDPAAFPKWLYRILERRVVDHVRAAIRRRRSDIATAESDSRAAESRFEIPLGDALESLAYR
jgi:RNA polymerase sigma-70 factor (ECF subfamily)